MAQEYEVKILDIDTSVIEQKLAEIGAIFIDEYFMKRWVLIEDMKSGEWIRLRDTGKWATITYKKKSGQGISETEEIETGIEDFEKTAQILKKLHCFTEKNYQENNRKLYKLGDIEFCIDTWPKIPTYLEVESGSEEKVYEGLALLGLTGKDVGNLSVIKVYEKYWVNLQSFAEMRF